MLPFYFQTQQERNEFLLFTVNAYDAFPFGLSVFQVVFSDKQKFGNEAGLC